MGSEIVLRYTVPVYVHVRPGRVTRVVVGDEAELEHNDEGFPVVVDTTDVDPHDTEAMEAAAATAENTHWPAWVFMS